MRPLSVFIFFVVSAIFQVTILEYFKFFGVKPDLLLIAVFIGALFLNFKAALILGVLAGVFKDSFSLGAFGLSAVLFPIWIILIRKLIRRVSVEDNLSEALLFFLTAVLNNIISGLVLIYAGVFVPLGIFMRITLLSSVYTSLVFYLIVRFILK